MRYLAIDYGLAHIGLAVSDGIIAQPYGQLAYFSDEKLIDEICLLCANEDVKFIVIGISEGQMADRIRTFADKLKQRIELPVELVDETLSSQEAVRLMVEADSKKSKRRLKNHQTAAAIILQEYLDNR